MDFGTIPILMEVNVKEEKEMLINYYEETLREIEEIEINLDNMSNNELRHAIRSISNRGWLHIETMFGKKKQKRHSKEEIQEHFNEMLKVVPMTKVRNES